MRAPIQDRRASVVKKNNNSKVVLIPNKQSEMNKGESDVYDLILHPKEREKGGKRF